jgi:hypothetical protein
VARSVPWTCWTSSGPRLDLMSRNETLEKWGVRRPVWTFWTSSPVGAGCPLSWQDHTEAVKKIPSGAGGAKQVQNVQTGGSTPVFFSVSLRDRCPAEVQTKELEPEGWLPCLARGRVRAGGTDGNPVRVRETLPLTRGGHTTALLCWFDRAGP